MIIFHEGLPRSGKSYEACAYQIIPALKEGRTVLTNLDGINVEKFSELTGIPAAFLAAHLISFYDPDIEEQKKQLLEKAGKDQLIVIDEIQDLFPSDRQKLGTDWMTFITQHGHEGRDILLMGQDRRDCHAIWRRRIQRVFTFNKLSAVGKENSYHWACFEATRPERYKEVNSGVRKYEPQYFGLYKSHTDGTGNKDNHKDDRANLLKNKKLIGGVVLAFVFAGLAINHLVGFFNPDIQEPESVAASNNTTTTVITDNATGLPVNAVPAERKPVDVFDDFASRYRLRLAALLINDEKMLIKVDVLDNSYHLKETFNLESLVSLGWDVTNTPHGIEITKDKLYYVARAWPLDPFGRTNNYNREQL